MSGKGCGCLVLCLGLINMVIFLISIISVATGHESLNTLTFFVLLLFFVNGGLLFMFGWQAWRRPLMINGEGEDGEEDDEGGDDEEEDEESEES